MVAKSTLTATGPTAARSALALELTGTHARALLLERVAGRARVVAHGESIATALGFAAAASSTAASSALRSRLRDDATPALIVVVGSADAPALARLGQALRQAAPARPAVIWAGPAADAEVARSALGDRVDF